MLPGRSSGQSSAFPLSENAERREVSAASSQAARRRAMWKATTARNVSTDKSNCRENGNIEEGCATSSTESASIRRETQPNSVESCEMSGDNLSPAKSDRTKYLQVPPVGRSRSPLSAGSPSTDEGIVPDVSQHDIYELSCKLEKSPRSSSESCEQFGLDDFKRRPMSHKDSGQPAGHDAYNLSAGSSTTESANQQDSSSPSKRRHQFKKRGPSRSNTDVPLVIDHGRNTVQMSTLKRKKRQAFRQYSTGHAPLDRTDQFDRRWDPMPVVYSSSRRVGEVDDAPVVVYCRSPKQANSQERNLPALFETNDFMSLRSDVNRHRARLNRFERSGSEKASSSRAQCASNEPAPEAESKLTENSNSNRSIGRSAGESELGFTRSDSSNRDEQNSLPVTLTVELASNKTSKETRDVEAGDPFSPASKASSMKTIPRSPSTRSALVDAVSSVVGATTSRGLLGKTPNDKQQSLTEQLSDPRRVQNIVESILCEMGGDRIVQYKNAFAKFDKDSSGIISSKQLRCLLRTLGHNPSDIELREMVNQVDVDENGKIDFNEFIILIGYFDKANNEDEDLRNIFQVFDYENLGSIPATALQEIADNYLHDVIPPDDASKIPPEELREMIEYIDHDGDRHIDREELFKILTTM